MSLLWHFRIRRALSFNGVDNYVRVPDADSLDITGPITVLAWLKLSELGRDQKVLHHQSPGFKLGVYTDNRVEFEIRDPTETAYLNRGVAGGTVLVANEWYLVGGWWDGSEIRSIVNGAFERPYAYTGTMGTTTNDLGLGVDYTFTSGWLSGLLDEVRVWNRALSETELKFLYNNGKGRKNPPPNGLVLDLDFNRWRGTERVKDLSKYQNNGSMVGATRVRCDR